MIEHMQHIQVQALKTSVIAIDDSHATQRIVIDIYEKAECKVIIKITQSKKIHLTINLKGSYAHVSILGYFRLSKDHKVEISTLQHHFESHTTSSLKIKGLLADDSSALYQGMIRIEQPAKYSNALQENKNILLSKNAQAQSIPGIEVLTDEVQCAHGSAIEYLDKQQLWYLQSRGIEIEQAEQLLIEAFLHDVIDAISI